MFLFFSEFNGDGVQDKVENPTEIHEYEIAIAPEKT